MRTALMRWEFKPDNGQEIGIHSMMSLVTHVAVPQGITEYEVQKVATAEPLQVVVVKKVGDFRRLI